MRLTSEAVADPKASKVVTSFLTEEDLNQYMVKFAMIFGSIIAPLFITEIIGLFKNKNAATKAQIDSLQKQVQDITLILHVLRDRPSVSSHEVENISRREAEKVLAITRGGRGGDL